MARDRARAARATGATRGCCCGCADAAQAERAAALAHAADARPQRQTRSASTPPAAAPARAPDAVRRLLRRLDDEGIRGELELVSAGRARARRRWPIERARLAEAWEAALATLPPDWSDLYAELELTSSDQLDRAALLLSPLNPARYGGKPALPLPRRAALRLRRLAGDGARAAWSAWTRRRSRAAAHPARALRHRPGRHPGPGLVRRRQGGLGARPDLLARARAGPQGRRPRTARSSARSTRCSATRSPTSSTGSRSPPGCSASRSTCPPSSSPRSTPTPST